MRKVFSVWLADEPPASPQFSMHWGLAGSSSISHTMQTQPPNADAGEMAGLVTYHLPGRGYGSAKEPNAPRPPSTSRSVAVMNEAASLLSHRTAAATSSG
jgi:hypothetical protein